jgi:hypothetical protein
MSDDQEKLKTEYRRLSKERAVYQQLVNSEAALWDGKGEKPIKLADAEASRDALDIEMARVADKVRF